MIQDLPSEIVENILLLACCGSTDEDYRGLQPNTTRLRTPAVKLSLVCQGWKQLIGNSGQLWVTVLNLETSLNYRYRSSDQFQRWRLGMAQSKDKLSNLDISIKFLTSDYDHSAAAMSQSDILTLKECIQDLGAHSNRIWRFKIESPAMAPVLAMIFGGLTSLDRLEWLFTMDHQGLYDGTSYPGAPTVPLNLEHAKGLQTLVFHETGWVGSIFPPRSLRCLIMPFDVKHASPPEISLEALLSLTQLCPDLQILRIPLFIYGKFIPEPTLEPPIRPKLRHLELGSTPMKILTFVGFFDLENLTHLKVELVQDDDEDGPIEKLKGFHLPRLSHLSVVLNDWDRFADAFLHAVAQSQLEELEILLMRTFPSRSASPSSPWPSLGFRKLKLEFEESLPGWRNFLSGLNLERMAFFSMRRRGMTQDAFLFGEESSEGVISTPLLQKMELINLGNFDTEDLCRSLDAPALTSIQFSYCNDATSKVRFNMYYAPFPRAPKDASAGQSPKVYSNVTSLTIPMNVFTLPLPSRAENPFKLFPNVTTLGLHLDATYFEKKNTILWSLASKPIMMGKLTTLKVYLQMIPDYGDEKSVGKAVEPCMEVLKRVAQWRLQYRIPLKKVILYSVVGDDHRGRPLQVWELTEGDLPPEAAMPTALQRMTGWMGLGWA